MITSSANAQTYSTTFNLADFGDASGNVVDHVIDFGTPVTSIQSISVDLSHSWVADLEIGLYSPTDNQTTSTALGDVDANASYILHTDEGGGDDIGLGGETLADVLTYTFVAPGTTGTTLGTAAGNPIPAGTYDAETWGSGGVGAGWRFVLTDDFGGDDGAIGNVTINFTSVPEPASATFLLGLTALIGVRRRR